MLTFQEKLECNICPAWRLHYVDYLGLKALVKTLQRRQSFLRTRGPETVPCLATEHSAFEAAFEANCAKVESWYLERLDEFTAQLMLLERQFKTLKSQQIPSPIHDRALRRAEEESFHMDTELIKDSFIELHRLFRLLRDFALLNYTALRKILKKHRKKCRDLSASYEQLQERLHEYAFAQAEAAQRLTDELETFYMVSFHDNDRVLALAELDGWKDDTLEWRNVYIGVKMGIVMVLTVWLLWDNVVLASAPMSSLNARVKLTQTKAYPVYRGIALLLFIHWLWGVTLYVWRSARINFQWLARYICELDPHTTADYAQVFDDASYLSIVYFINFLLYAQVVSGELAEVVPRGYYPLALVIFVVYHYCLKEWSKQKRLLHVLHDIVLLPLFPVTYFHTFVGNYLTSATKMNQDFAWTVCFFATGEFRETDELPSTCATNFYYTHVAVPLICAVPVWWRFLQSLRRCYELSKWFPGLPNALKYAFAQLVILFGLFHSFYSPLAPSNSLQIVWVCLFVLSSLYSWLWDVVMDWGLGRPQYKFLGDAHMYSRKWVYYVAIAVNFMLSFSWTLALIPPNNGSPLGALLLEIQPITMFMEPMRRAMWSCFAMENEHLRNTFGFRKENFIPLHFERKPETISKPDSMSYAYKIAALGFIVVALSISAVAVD
ncbi:hypothetical protein ACHHYP_17193 [Achlya hypogyna]|uniref:SPX domain-containing protein n=1 Tax=Achlya hypogyna TaxID=1202772 RepID=A0A1V9ZDG3_ACHHY|nr:hypothetical protein ACHHYP_17193 [Achlya hypogyna]